MCELRIEVGQMKTSVVPPNLTRDLEVKIESQKNEIQSSKKSTDNTRFTEQLDEVNLNSIQGIDEMKMLPHRHHPSAEFTEPAMSQGMTPSCSYTTCRKQHEIDCNSTSEHLEHFRDNTQFSFSDDFFTNWKDRSYSDSF